MAAPLRLLSYGFFYKTLTIHRHSLYRNSLESLSSQRFLHGGKSPIIVEQVGPVQLIAINRPEKKNAIDYQTSIELLEVIERFDEDRNSRVGVIYGKGGCFCSGYDLSELADSDINIPISKERGPMGPTRYRSRKPLIASIEGYAVAGGLELALWCDLRVMEETAILGVFCRRFGVPLIDGGTVRLPQLIGLSRALDLILTGREVRAKEALDIGLIHRITETGAALGRAVLLAQEIAKFPVDCLKADRGSAYYSSYDASSFDDALEFEHNNGIAVLESESRKGAQSFMSGIGKHGSFNLRKKQD